MLCLVWIPFFISPFLWADIFIAAQTQDVLFLGAGLFAAACMWTYDPSKSSRIITDPAWLFLILCISPVLIHLLLNDLRSPWHAWRQILYFTAAWLVFQMCRPKAHILLEQRAFIYLLGAAAALYTSYALIQAYDIRFLTGQRLFPVWSDLVARFPGPLMQPNWQGIFQAIVTLALLFHLSRQNINKSSGFILSMISCTGLLLTASRSAFIAFLIGCLILYWISSNRRQSLYLISLCILSSILISAMIQSTIPGSSSPSIVNRIEAGSFLDRIVIWDLCWQLYKQHLFIGIGWGNLPAHSLDGLSAAFQAHPMLTQSPTNGGGHAWAHNLILQFAVEAGIFGVFAIFILIWSVLSRIISICRSNSRSLSKGSILGSILALMLLVHGMLSVSTMQPFFQVLLALCVAAIFPTKEKLNA